MQNLTRFALGLGAAAVVASGGSAFTAGQTMSADNVAGYNTANVSGATVTGIEHTLSSNGTKILSTALTFNPAVTSSAAVKAAFGTVDLLDCVEGTVTSGAFTTATCTWGDATTSPFSTASAGVFNVAVS